MSHDAQERVGGEISGPGDLFLFYIFLGVGFPGDSREKVFLFLAFVTRGLSLWCRREGSGGELHRSLQRTSTDNRSPHRT